MVAFAADTALPPTLDLRQELSLYLFPLPSLRA
jgi:hypothetical protein